MAAYILVFDKDKAPNNAKDFANWFEKKAQWKEQRNYYDIKGTSKNLSDFYLEITKEFPADYPEDEELAKKCVDYTIDSDLIYMCCPWSISIEFWEKVEELAQKYNLGYSDLDKIYWDENNVTKYELSYKQELQKKKDKPLETIRKILTALWIIGFISLSVPLIIFLITRDKKYLYTFLVIMIITYITIGIQETITNKLIKRQEKANNK